jgi:iron complex outermembrane receptor protein
MPSVPRSIRLPIQYLCVFLALLLAQTSISVLSAQAAKPTAPIQGSVLDPDGKTVTGATIVLRRDNSDEMHTAVTDASGHFSADGLEPGVYVLDISAAGFTTVRRRIVHTTDGRASTLVVTLAIGSLTEEVTVAGALPEIARVAPSQGSLSARSAQSEISGTFIENFTSPVADYTQVLQMAPGTFSYSPNGQGLGDSKTFFRGFSDGQYNMTFDGIPFNDTNTPTHHSWAFFPAQFIGSTVFDRSPGSASTIGPTSFGGSVNLLSQPVDAQPSIAGTVSYGSFNTRLFDADYHSGRFGPGDTSRLTVEGHEMTSDGYQTYNTQKRQAISGKYQVALSNNTTLTAFASYILLHTNTPNTKGPTRAQVDQFGPKYLLSGDPSQPNYFGYNFYRVPTDFDYLGLRSNLGHGWSVDDKVYTYRYYNKQNYNGATISTTSATDKLNSYRKYGNLLPFSQVSRFGVLHTGLWAEHAYTDRYQIPSDPRTWIDAPLPNFHEMFNTTTLQPYGEYQFSVTDHLRLTPGIKLAYYRQNFTQLADNGKTVGNLNGAASISHAASYDTWLPSLDGHYLLRPNWSAYAQYSTGSVIPPTSVFDVKDASVSLLPDPTTTKTFQVGSVWKGDRFTLDLDTYYIHFDNAYSSIFDPSTGETAYFANGTSVTQGFEAETNILLGNSVSLYLNGTVGSATYADSDLWVDSAARDTEALGVSYNGGRWNVGLFTKRVGKMFNDNGSVHEAVPIDPNVTANLFVNYTFRGDSAFKDSKIRLSVNNLFNDQSIVAVTPASTKTSVASPDDTLIILPERSVAVTFTVGLSRR